jgi:hypothetical protein
MGERETSEGTIELVARRIGRTEYLIAQFSGGYAAGWQFPLPEAFKDALDIKLTTKMVRKVPRQVWTQGQSFGFKEGDAVYNSLTAYTDFPLFLKGANPVGLKVIRSTPSGYETKTTYVVGGNEVHYQKIGKSSTKAETASSFRVLEQVFEAGKVDLMEFRPNPAKDGLEQVREFSLRQDQLVTLLQAGWYWDNETGTVVDYRYAEQRQ